MKECFAMPLNPGNPEATAGMAQSIYVEMDRLLRPRMGGLDEDGLRSAQDAWKQLSYAIAVGVIEHLKRENATESEYAEVFSSSVEDSAFWNWLGEFARRVDPSRPPPTRLKGIIR